MLITFVDIADSNQLPQGKVLFLILRSCTNLVFYLRATRPVCCPFYTNIIFRTKLSSRKSAIKLDFFLERQLHHDCSQAQLLFVPQYIISIRTGTLSEAVF